MPDTDGVTALDDAIARWLRDGSPAALRALVHAGPSALRRAMEVYYGGAAPDAVRRAGEARHGRVLADAWAVALGALARAYPEVYLSAFDTGGVPSPGGHPTLEAVILGGLDAAGAVGVLCRYAGHPDPLVRLHAVAGLGRRAAAGSAVAATDAEAAMDAEAAVAAAVTDEDRTVRDEAACWLQRRDPRAAAERYRRLLAGRDLPPGLRGELTRRLATAKRLTTVARLAALRASGEPDAPDRRTGRG